MEWLERGIGVAKMDGKDGDGLRRWEVGKGIRVFGMDREGD